jgi:pyruvate,water dikinase
VERLGKAVAQIAAAFYSRPVIVRLSDFKTNEYGGLVGGRVFEPVEDNPMIGFRGASRYLPHARRGDHELEVYVMCEIPNNVVLAEEFAELFDGFSIGSNDLTQLTLGIDRDSEILAPLFSEQDPGVMRSIATVIERAHAKRRKVGLCGQAPSDHPEFAKFLAAQRIDSISVTPDALPAVLRVLAEP